MVVLALEILGWWVFWELHILVGSCGALARHRELPCANPLSCPPNHSQSNCWRVCKLHRGCRLFKEVFAQAAKCHCESERKEVVMCYQSSEATYTRVISVFVGSTNGTTNFDQIPILGQICNPKQIQTNCQTNARQMPKGTTNLA